MTADFRKTLQEREAAKQAAQAEAAQAAQARWQEETKFIADFKDTMARDVWPVINQFIQDLKAEGYDAQPLNSMERANDPFIGVRFFPEKGQKIGSIGFDQRLLSSFTIAADANRKLAVISRYFDQRINDRQRTANDHDESSIQLVRITQHDISSSLHEFMVKSLDSRDRK